LEKLNEASADEIIKIEKKYNIQRIPLYTKRNEIIKRIPGFWKQTFLNHDLLHDILTDIDQEILESVVDIQVEEFIDDKGGYRIALKLKNNPYVKNDSLVKEFSWGEEGPTMQATTIDWKKEPKEDSFFSFWFKSSSGEEAQNDDIAAIIKEQIWSDPAKCYHGLFEPGEVDEEDEDDDEEGNE